MEKGEFIACYTDAKLHLGKRITNLAIGYDMGFAIYHAVGGADDMTTGNDAGIIKNLKDKLTAAELTTLLKALGMGTFTGTKAEMASKIVERCAMLMNGRLRYLPLGMDFLHINFVFKWHPFGSPEGMASTHVAPTMTVGALK